MTAWNSADGQRRKAQLGLGLGLTRSFVAVDGPSCGRGNALGRLSLGVRSWWVLLETRLRAGARSPSARRSAFTQRPADIAGPTAMAPLQPARPVGRMPGARPVRRISVRGACHCRRLPRAPGGPLLDAPESPPSADGPRGHRLRGRAASDACSHSLATPPMLLPRQHIRDGRRRSRWLPGQRLKRGRRVVRRQRSGGLPLSGDGFLHVRAALAFTLVLDLGAGRRCGWWSSTQSWA